LSQQLWTPKRGPAVLRAPKSRNSFRTIALSTLVVDALAAHMAAFGSGRDGLVFHYEGRPIVRAQGSKYVRKAGVAVGLDRFGWHDLRHHHASVLLSRGISPALVAERLGQDIKTLLRTYAHVIRSDEDRVRAVVDDTLGQTAEDWLRTEGVS
jgi:integrase